MDRKALFLGIDTCKHDWPNQWMPVFRKHGFKPGWASLGTHWHTALPKGTEPEYEYDVRDIVDFAKWRQGDSDTISYASPDITDEEVLSTIGYMERLLLKYQPSLLCVWSHSTFQNRGATAIARRLQIPVFYLEGAFFCSPRTWGHMHIMDPIGVYFQGESYLHVGWEEVRDRDLTEMEKQRVVAFLHRWTGARRSKYEQTAGPVTWPRDKKLLFVPLQTPHDGTMWWPRTVVNSPAALVRAIVENAGSEWYPVFKKHPRDRTPIDRYRCDIDRDYAIVEHGNVHDLIDASDGVALINSTVGIEALARGRRVVTLGDAFYGGEGWTEDVQSVDEIPEALNRLAAQPTVVGEPLEKLHRFLAWLLWCYLADFADPFLEERYRIAQAVAQRGHT
jgi:capsule polysaccharide export protein KpsC/LpsZ